MSDLHPFEQSVARAWPPRKWSDITVLVAVSGGPDSVALLRALNVLASRTPGRLVVTHFNHCLRGDDSDADARFVERLSHTLQLPCEIGRADGVSDGAASRGTEAEARGQRYSFFREVADRVGARFLATAHTADDQAETILHRIIRGTGLAGLSGIPLTRCLTRLTTVVRPMLNVDRQAVCRYLESLKQGFCEDHTNQLTDFTRNRIRHELIPDLAGRYNPRVSQALIRLGRLAQEAQAVIDGLVIQLQDQCLVKGSETRIRIDCSPLAKQTSYVVREFLIAVWKSQEWPLQDMSHEKWQQLCELACGQDKTALKVTLPGGVVAVVSGTILELVR